MDDYNTHIVGPLSFHQHKESGTVRYISFDGVEIVRSVYVAVRDRFWNTLPCAIRDVQTSDTGNNLIITFDAVHTENNIDVFKCKMTIDCNKSPTVMKITMDGEVVKHFFKNRIGVCLLNPLQGCVGMPCEVNGSVKSHFPDTISPWCPFQDIKSISYLSANEQSRVTIQFDGDYFEMEDQRNWTDASFKIYSTPVANPMPVEVLPGDKFHHVITISAISSTPIGSPQPPLTPSSSIKLQTDVAKILHPIPKIGLGVSTGGAPLSEIEVHLLKKLNLSHFRVDLDITSLDLDKQTQILNQAISEAELVGVQLELGVSFSRVAEKLEKELDTFVLLWKPRGHATVKVVRILIFFNDNHHKPSGTDEELLRKVRATFTSIFSPLPKIGGGTNTYFANCNRNRPTISDAFEFINFSINPQVHTFDELSLTENIKPQADVVRSAKALSEGLPVVVSPVTLRPRFNPMGERDTLKEELPFEVDPRQPSLYAASWTVGSLHRLFSEGLESVTYFETTGWRGIMESHEKRNSHTHFKTVPSQVFPIYHIFHALLSEPDQEVSVLPASSSAPLQCELLALKKKTKGEQESIQLLVANLTNKQVDTVVDVVRLGGSKSTSLWILDSTNSSITAKEWDEWYHKRAVEHFNTTAEIRLQLQPYAIAFIDIQ